MSGASCTVEFTIRHPNGAVDGSGSATTFGPTPVLADVQVRLEIADSDCLCSDSDEPHTIVRRTVTVSPWKPANGDDACSPMGTNARGVAQCSEGHGDYPDTCDEAAS